MSLPTTRAGEPDTATVRAAVDAVPLWYHVLDLPGGVATPGWFDQRPVVDRIPWPDLRGRRCLDVGTYDGFLAFAMERAGAAEVVALDIPDHRDWDVPLRGRASIGARLGAVAGEDKGAGFRTAHRLLRSSVRRVEGSIYALDPAELGTFDVVVCGSLLLHLRDPVRALEAVRSVCTGTFVSVEQVDPTLDPVRRRPVARFDGSVALNQWWVVNGAGHDALLRTAGFAPTGAARTYGLPFGPAHPVPSGVRTRVRGAAVAALVRGRGVPHRAVATVPDPAAAPVATPAPG